MRFYLKREREGVQEDIRNERTLEIAYYFSPKLSARLGGEVKSLTGGHYAAKRISLRQTSTVIPYCVI